MRIHVSLLSAVALALSACSSESASVDCSSVASSYAAALKDAVVCDPLVANTCSATRAAALQDVCQCQVAVNPTRTAQVDELEALFKAQGCGSSQAACNAACPAVAKSCVAPAAAAPTCTGS